jgi:hypothetical protein
VRTVELDEATGHPDLESHRAALEAVRKRLRGQTETGFSVAVQRLARWVRLRLNR